MGDLLETRFTELHMDFGIGEEEAKDKQPIERQSTFAKIKETYKAYHQSLHSDSSDPTTEGDNDNEFII